MNLDLTKLRYQQTCEIWQNMCHLHRVLFDLTCDEYLSLLKSDLDNLELIIDEKDAIIAEIGELEAIRRKQISNIEQDGILAKPINDAATLIREFEAILGNDLLSKTNLLLMDLIDSIRVQNKKNQLFLNKAMQSIQDIKDTFSGKKNYPSYGRQGKTEKLSVR